MEAGFRDRYPHGLDHEADQDVLLSADSGLYRRIHARMPVAGLPDQITIGAVAVSFTFGPVRTQRTDLRQRPGFPFIFDKHMQRGLEIGAGEYLTVLELPVSVHHGIHMDAWRSIVDTASGLLVSTLDERVVGTQLGEDVILLRDGDSVAAADEVSRVRTFMPFEVTSSDLSALARLANVDVQENSPGNTAAALLGAATREGPSRLGFLLMWLAVDAIVYKRGTKQARALESALSEAGFAEAWLQMPVGRLASLRGKIAHGKPESDELIHKGFYDMEAIARLLIARSCGLSAAWPAAPEATAFLPSVARLLGPNARKYEEVWHQHGLPAVDPTGRRTDAGSAPARYDAVLDGHAASIRIETTGSPCDVRMLRWALWQGLFVLDLPAESFRVTVTADHDYGPRSLIAVGSERILVSPSHPTAFGKEPDDSLVLDLCEVLAQHAAMKAGLLPNQPIGVFLLELVGAWASQFAVSPEQLLWTPTENDQSPAALGRYTGLSIAGNDAASRALQQLARTLPEDIVLIVEGIRETLADAETLNDVLRGIQGIADHPADDAMPPA